MPSTSLRNAHSLGGNLRFACWRAAALGTTLGLENEFGLKPMKYTWRYAAATVAVEFQEGLGLVELRGPITNDVLCQARLDIVQHQPKEVLVYIFCWDRAVLATSFDVVAQGLTDGRLERLLRLPIANVTSPEQADAFHRYAFSVIRSGLVRVTFLELGDALLWASRKIAFSEAASSQALQSALLPPRAQDCERADSRRTL